MRLRLISDVPLGAFLSGGIDSAAVVALMRARRAGPVHTFSIGFDDARLQRAAHARARSPSVSAPSTTSWSSRPALADDPAATGLALQRAVRRLLGRADLSLWPAWRDSTVTVALNGDGGDEIFAGYRRYLGAARCCAPSRGLPARAPRGADAGGRCARAAGTRARRCTALGRFLAGLSLAGGRATRDWSRCSIRPRSVLYSDDFAARLGSVASLAPVRRRLPASGGLDPVEARSPPTSPSTCRTTSW